MHRIDTPSALSSMPAPGAAGTQGYFGGNAEVYTVLDADWANDQQEELMSILAAASISPDKTVHNQVLTALTSLFALPAFATLPQFLGGTDTDHPLNAAVMAAADDPAALTDASTTAWDASQRNQVSWKPLADGHALSISNPLPGRYYSLLFNANGHSVVWDSAIRWSGGAAPPWSTGLGSHQWDDITLHCLDDGVTLHGTWALW